MFRPTEPGKPFVTTSHDLDITIDQRRDHLVVAVAGEIDYGNVSRLRSALLDLAREPSGDEVRVDLSQVAFIDSTALSVLVQAKQRLETQGRSMTVFDPQPRVERVLELGGLLEYLGQPSQGRGSDPAS